MLREPEEVDEGEANDVERKTDRVDGGRAHDSEARDLNRSVSLSEVDSSNAASESFP